MKKIICLVFLFLSIKLPAQCTLSVTVNYTAPSCPTCCDGVIEASTQGAFCTSVTFTLFPQGFSTPNATFTNLCVGSYTVKGQDFCFCVGTCSVTLPSGSTNIESIPDLLGSFDVYPNPTSRTLYISMTGNIDQKSQIEIKNALGQNVLETELKNEIDVSELPEGYYFLTVLDEYSKPLTFPRKLIVAK